MHGILRSQQYVALQSLIVGMVEEMDESWVSLYAVHGDRTVKILGGEIENIT